MHTHPIPDDTSRTDARVDVLGVGISVIDLDRAVDLIHLWLTTGQRQYVCLTPVSGVMAAQRNPAVLRALNGAGLTAPDGMPMVWAGRYAGAAGIGRVYGPDLMTGVLERGLDAGWKSFLYGGGHGTVGRLRERLEFRFPGVDIVGTSTPPFRPLEDHEKEQVAETINASCADLVWVGLSTPKQDLWMAEMVERLKRPIVMLGVGAAFDIHAGLVRPPPAWMGPLGLFWLYRLLQEPRRLWKRYARDIPLFMLKVVRNRPHRQ